MAVVPVLLGKLGDRCGLAAAVDPDNENDKGLSCHVEPQRFHDRLDEPDYLFGQRRADLLWRHLLVEAGLAQRLGDLACDTYPHVARDQQLLELEECLVIEPAAVEDRVDALGEPRRAARHPGPEPGEQALAFLSAFRSRSRFRLFIQNLVAW